jgi:hypothetical protein
LFKLKKNNKKEKSSYNIVKELLPTKRKWKKIKNKK